MDQTTLIGFTGATLILIAFVLNQIKKWRDDDLVYDVFNFIGGALMVYYALLILSYPFAVLNSVWALVSLKDILIKPRKNHVQGMDI